MLLKLGLAVIIVLTGIWVALLLQENSALKTQVDWRRWPLTAIMAQDVKCTDGEYTRYTNAQDLAQRQADKDARRACTGSPAASYQSCYDAAKEASLLVAQRANVEAYVVQQEACTKAILF